MCHDFLHDASLFQSLTSLDRCIADQVRREGCPHCGGALHVSNYPRKPRGVARALLGECYEYRLSFCCDQEGCRKRCTPPSVRFLGRKLYLGIIVILLCAREQGLSAHARHRLLDQLDIWPQTLARWQHWWTRQIPATRWWTTLRGRLIPALDVRALPGALLGRVDKSALDQLAQRTWTHPINGTALHYSASTIERWLYRARDAQDPVSALRTDRRTDAGRHRQISPALSEQLWALDRQYPGWTMQLLYDNLVVVCEEDNDLPSPPSYSTVRRYLKAQGWHRRRSVSNLRPGQVKAQERREAVEVRSYEALYPDSLWHLDFHVCSRSVLTR